jgi:hypothetical protein
MMGAFATVCDFGNHLTVRMAFVEAALLVGFGLGNNIRYSVQVKIYKWGKNLKNKETTRVFERL